MMRVRGWPRKQFGQVGVGSYDDQNLPRLLSSVDEVSPEGIWDGWQW